MPRSWLFAALWSLAIFGFSLTARAQRVALVRPAEGDATLLEAFNRLNAELRLQDLEVTVVEPGEGGAPRGGLEETARAAGAVASIAFTRRAGRAAADLWFIERATGQASSRSLEPASDVDAPTLLAIRSVDLLRTALRELAREKPTPPPAATPPPDTPAPLSLPVPTPVPTSPERPLWKFRAEGVVLWDRPGFGFGVGAGLSVARRVSERFEIGVAACGPLVGANFTTAQGSASVAQTMAWGELRVTALRSEWLDLGVSLGAGVHRLQAAGQSALPPYTPADDEVFSALGLLGVHAEMYLASNVAFGIHLRAAALAPRPGIQVGSSISVLELPLLGASAGLLVGF